MRVKSEVQLLRSLKSEYSLLNKLVCFWQITFQSPPGGTLPWTFFLLKCNFATLLFFNFLLFNPLLQDLFCHTQSILKFLSKSFDVFGLPALVQQNHGQTDTDKYEPKVNLKIIIAIFRFLIKKLIIVLERNNWITLRSVQS